MTAPASAPVLRVVRLPGADPEVALPAPGSEGAAGLDLRANLEPGQRAEGLSLAPGARMLVPTGLAFGLPDGWEAQVRPRSGLALRHGVTVLNAPGTIDADYRGEVGVLLVNLGAAPFALGHGMRIAQVVLSPAARAEVVEAEDLPGSARGVAGFGSTGTR